MIVKLLTERHLEFLSLKGGCRGSSESTLVKISNCWKSRALAQLKEYCLCTQVIDVCVVHAFCINNNELKRTANTLIYLTTISGPPICFIYVFVAIVMVGVSYVHEKLLASII